MSQEEKQKADNALKVIQKGNGLVKVVSCGRPIVYHKVKVEYEGAQDTTNWDFILDQLLDPEMVRPIRHRNQVYHTEKTRWNPKTRQTETVNNVGKRGRPKKTVLTKKTSTSLLPETGKMHLFVSSEHSVAILFDLEELVRLHKQYQKDPEKYVFYNDANTCCWWKETNHRDRESSVSFDALRKQSTFSTTYNELLMRLSKSAMIGIIATENTLTGRLSALHKKYYIRLKTQGKGMELELPILIIDGFNQTKIYEESEQKQDLIEGLKTGHPFSHLIQKIKNQVEPNKAIFIQLENFLEQNDVKLFENMIHNNRKTFEYYQRKLLILGIQNNKVQLILIILNYWPDHNALLLSREWPELLKFATAQPDTVLMEYLLSLASGNFTMYWDTIVSCMQVVLERQAVNQSVYSLSCPKNKIDDSNSVTHAQLIAQQSLFTDVFLQSMIKKAIQQDHIAAFEFLIELGITNYHDYLTHAFIFSSGKIIKKILQIDKQLIDNSLLINYAKNKKWILVALYLSERIIDKPILNTLANMVFNASNVDEGYIDVVASLAKQGVNLENSIVLSPLTKKNWLVIIAYLHKYIDTLHLTSLNKLLFAAINSSALEAIALLSKKIPVSVEHFNTAFKVRSPESIKALLLADEKIINNQLLFESAADNNWKLTGAYLEVRTVPKDLSQSLWEMAWHSFTHLENDDAFQVLNDLVKKQQVSAIQEQVLVINQQKTKYDPTRFLRRYLEKLQLMDKPTNTIFVEKIFDLAVMHQDEKLVNWIAQWNGHKENNKNDWIAFRSYLINETKRWIRDSKDPRALVQQFNHFFKLNAITPYLRPRGLHSIFSRCQWQGKSISHLWFDVICEAKKKILVLLKSQENPNDVLIEQFLKTPTGQFTALFGLNTSSGHEYESITKQNIRFDFKA